jgi:hypothetical protein
LIPNRLLAVVKQTQKNVLAWGEAALNVANDAWSIADALLARRHREFHQLECLLARATHGESSEETQHWQRQILEAIAQQNTAIELRLLEIQNQMNESLSTSSQQKKIARFATGDRNQFFKRSV